MVIQVTYLLTEYRQESVPADRYREGISKYGKKKKAMLPES